MKKKPQGWLAENWKHIATIALGVVIGIQASWHPMSDTVMQGILAFAGVLGIYSQGHKST